MGVVMEVDEAVEEFSVGGLESFDIEIVGVVPLMCHNVRMASPFDPFTRALKKITAKKKNQTDDDRIMASKVEFFGGMYWLNDGGFAEDSEVGAKDFNCDTPIMPGANIEACIRDGAKVTRSGQNAIAGISVPEDSPIIYSGPKGGEELWASGKFADTRSVKIQKNVIDRTRPIFRQWSLKFTVYYDTEVIANEDTVRGFIREAGRIKGIGDYHPRFGRFRIAE